MRESREMYLETIYVLTKVNGPVHAIEVCQHMGFSKPSVSRAVGLLKKDGYIFTDENGALNLTPQGKMVAEKIYERHTILTQFLIKIGVSPEVASDDACKIEHDISDETLEAIRQQIDK